MFFFDKITCNEIDDVISAEITDVDVNRGFHDIVVIKSDTWTLR